MGCRCVATALIGLMLGTYVPESNGATLPEFYGVYVKDRGKLTELQPNLLETERRNFTPKLRVIVFDKVVDSGRMRPSDFIYLNKRAYVRWQIEQLVDEPESQPKKVIKKPAGWFITLAAKIQTRFKPVQGNQEMLIVVPAQALSAGLYSVRIGKRKYPIAVGLGDTAEKESTYNNCLDEYVKTIDTEGKFSWSKWNAISGAGLTGRRVNGHPVYESSFQLCSAYQ